MGAVVAMTVLLSEDWNDNAPRRIQDHSCSLPPKIDCHGPARRRLGDGRLGGFPHIEYFSAAVAPTGDLGDRCCCRSPRLGLPRFEEGGEPAVAIGLQEASEDGRMFAAVGAKEVDRRRRFRAAEWPVVADIHP
jgi:hypothetical protein